MSKRTAQPHAISGVFVFLVLGVFAVFSTVMVLLGARAYKSTADRAAEHNSYRVASAYLRSMIRGDDEDQALRVEEVTGVVLPEDGEDETAQPQEVRLTTVALRNVYDDEEYVTRLYVFDGMLREWNTEADVEFEPAYGESVCPMEEMTAELNGQLLQIRLRNREGWTQVDIALRAAAD